MSTHTIRAFESRDFQTVLDLWNQSMPCNAMEAEAFASRVLANPDFVPGDDSGFLVAEADGKVVGAIRVVVRHSPNCVLGLEPDKGFIHWIAVESEHQSKGIGTALLNEGMEYFSRHNRTDILACGTPQSALGTIVPGIDTETQEPAIGFFEKHGFTVDQHGYSMERSLIDFTPPELEPDNELVIELLTPERASDFIAFAIKQLPGSWSWSARAKVAAGEFSEILIARLGEEILGYCQWSFEHFGPFGVAPAARNRKVGARVFAESVSRIIDAGGKRIWFNWADDNAKRFYDRFDLNVTREFAVMRKKSNQ